MPSAVEQLNRRMLRARDAIDRSYAQPLDIPSLAAVAHVSEAHFIRTFKTTFGETPHRYLQRRRVERAMNKLVESRRSITDICFDVGFTSLGTFSRTFHDIVGCTPSEYRALEVPKQVPNCFTQSYMRPYQSRSSTFGEARPFGRPIASDAT
jgi:AraC-like DNA-binding protein